MTDTPQDPELVAANFRVVGTIFPEGSGRAAQTMLSVGDGFPPTVVIRVGMDKETVVVDVTVGGFPDQGSTDATLKEVAQFLGEVAASLQQTPAWEGTYGVN